MKKFSRLSLRLGLFTFTLALTSLSSQVHAFDSIAYSQVHQEITRTALNFLREEILVAPVGLCDVTSPGNCPRGVIDGNDFEFDAAQSSNTFVHFDSCNFSGTSAYIRNTYNTLLGFVLEGDVRAPELFGNLLHPVQDFYAHSNWVELGNTIIFDNTVDEWPNLTPFSTYNGVYIVQNTPNPGHTVELDGKIVWVDDVYPGLITGTTDNAMNGCPPGAVIGHWDADPDNPASAFKLTEFSPDYGEPGYGTGLNKDFGDGLIRHGREGFEQARELAIEQTRHEWCRLVNLVSKQLGDHVVANLFNTWVDPARMNDAISACSRLNIAVFSQIPELLDLTIESGVDSHLLDLIFVIDTTGSMADDIAEVKNRALDIINQVAASGSDWQIAIVTYRDHPQAPYGDSGDYVSRVEVPFSSDQNAIIAAINGIIVGGGGDGPEAVYAGLMQAIGQDWRNGARKVVVLMGDAPPHDPDPILGYTSQTVLQAAYDVDPASIFPILITDQNAVRYPFQVLADGSSGRIFYAANATEVVPTILSTISVATGVQLSIGLEVQVASLEPAFPMRAAPTMSAAVVANLPRSERAVITEGPQVVFDPPLGDIPQHFIWWKIRTASGQEGWIQETYYGEPILIPFSESNPLTPVDCTLTTRGDVNIRSGPGTEYQQIASRAGAGNLLAANGQYGDINNPQAHWWQLINGFWIRNDQVTEAGNCPALPVIPPP